MWQEKEGMFNVERWGEYKCKRWIWLGKLEGRWQAWHGQGLMVVGHGAYEHGHMTSTHSHGGAYGHGHIGIWLHGVGLAHNFDSNAWVQWGGMDKLLLDIHMHEFNKAEWTSWIFIHMQRCNMPWWHMSKLVTYTIDWWILAGITWFWDCSEGYLETWTLHEV